MSFRRSLRWLLVTVLFVLILTSQNLPTFHIVYDISVPTLLQGGGEHNGDIFVISIWSGVRSLWKRGARVLAVMVAVWSGALPLAKTLLLLLDKGRLEVIAKKLGRLAFLDIYAVFVIFLAVRISNIHGCKTFLGIKMCKDVGMIYAEPMYGLLYFGACIAVLNMSFYFRSSARRYTRVSLPKCRILLNLLALCFLVSGATLPLCSIEVHSKLDMVTLQPKLLKFTLVETASPAFGFTSAANYSNAAFYPSSKIPLSGLASKLAALVFTTVFAVPGVVVLLNIVMCLMELVGYHAVTSLLCRVLAGLNEWNHALVFCFSVWLVEWQIESLSQEFSLPPELMTSFGLDAATTTHNLVKMSLHLDTGFFLLCCSGVLLESLLGYGKDIPFGSTAATESGSSEELEQLKPAKGGPSYL